MTKINEFASRAYAMKLVSGDDAAVQNIDPSRTLYGVIDGELRTNAIVDVDFLPPEPKTGIFYHLPDGTLWYYSNDTWVRASVDMDEIEREISAGVQEAKTYTDTRGFVTNSVNNLLNYYLKTETYTKSEVDDIISAIEKITMRVVDELPAVGEPNVIYLVPKTPEPDDTYDEFIYTNNKWEKIGNTAIDLTDYAKKDWVSAQIADFLTATQIQALVDAKENTITAGTTAQYWRGDKTWQTLDKNAVALGNVDNTSDATKKANFKGTIAEDDAGFVTGGDIYDAFQEDYAVTFRQW